MQLRPIDDGAAGTSYQAGVQWVDGFIVNRPNPRGRYREADYDDFGVGGASKYL
jgi:hypothetical protein